jgi:hydrogenase nickel incorporation protein HypA/HybF
MVVQRAAGRRVSRVTVRVGYLRQVVPDAMVFAWEMLTRSTDLDGAVLAIEHMPVVVRCRACAATTTLDVPVLACHVCGSVDVDLESGDELLLVSFETTGQVPAAGVG